MEGTGEFGVRMNTMPKYVVSSTLREVTWSGSQLVRGDLATEIAKLKEKPGRDLLLSGSGRLFNELMRENLIDLYRFMVHPVVLGKGARLLDDGGTERVLELVGTQSFDTGILILEYRPSPQTTR